MSFPLNADSVTPMKRSFSGSQPSQQWTPQSQSAPQADKDPDSILEKLADYLKACGGTWTPGWSVEVLCCLLAFSLMARFAPVNCRMM
jgi:hypothetical protein